MSQFGNDGLNYYMKSEWFLKIYSIYFISALFIFHFSSAGWPFGSLVCKLSGMVQGISVSASVFTLVAIAVDRWAKKSQYICS